MAYIPLSYPAPYMVLGSYYVALHINNKVVTQAYVMYEIEQQLLRILRENRDLMKKVGRNKLTWFI